MQLSHFKLLNSTLRVRNPVFWRGAGWVCKANLSKEGAHRKEIWVTILLSGMVDMP